MLFGAVGMASCFFPGIPAPSSPAVVDAELIAGISRAFHEAGIDGYQNIQIEAERGIVTLRGRVGDHAIAEQLVRCAYTVSGVELVVSFFSGPQSTPAAQSTPAEKGGAR
ncbi:MAG: BON domain-containing protein [Planctomycetota bacterium]